MSNKLLYLLIFTCCLYACKKQPATETTVPKESTPDSNTTIVSKDCNQVIHEANGKDVDYKTYLFDDYNRIIGYKDITVTYHRMNKIIRETDNAGNVTEYEVDNDKKLIRKTGTNTEISYQWDENGFPTMELINDGSKQDTLLYTHELSDGNIIKQTIKYNNGRIETTIMTYDLSKPNTLPKGRYYTFEPGKIETYNNKNLVLTQDKNMFRYEFDSFGRVISCTRNAYTRLLSTTYYEYRCAPF